MKILKLIVVVLIITSITSCKKKSSVVIQAQNLTNLSDGSHYASAHYMVIERRSGLSIDDIKSKTLVDDYLDVNGRASFEIKMKNNRTYVLGIAKPENICYTEITIEYFLDHNKNNNITFKYAPCGFYRPLYKNINCEGTDDKMQYKFYYTDNPDIYIYIGFGTLDTWNDLYFIEGCYDNTNLSNVGVFDVPVGNYTIEWRVIRPSGTTTGIDYFTVTEGDTTSYILEY